MDGRCRLADPALVAGHSNYHRVPFMYFHTLRNVEFWKSRFLSIQKSGPKHKQYREWAKRAMRERLGAAPPGGPKPWRALAGPPVQHFAGRRAVAILSGPAGDRTGAQDVPRGERLRPRQIGLKLRRRGRGLEDRAPAGGVPAPASAHRVAAAARRAQLVELRGSGLLLDRDARVADPLRRAVLRC